VDKLVLIELVERQTVPHALVPQLHEAIDVAAVR
jgi:hypothetical protein